jgi:diguanylate cyclase (GGDEF)-like protein
LNQWHLQTANGNEEDGRTARILFTLIGVFLGAYLFVVFIGVYFNDWKLIVVSLTGIVLQIVPLGLLKRGYLGAGGFFIMLIVLSTLTITATLGQGIRDLAIIAFPTVFIFASLSLKRKAFAFCVGLTLAAVGWLALGESYGLFTPLPYEGSPGWINFLIVAVILVASAVAVDLLATNMRSSLALARSEITQRKMMEEQLRYQGTHDILTGIYNRVFFEAELARLERSREFPISIIVADMDRLKATNDARGHTVGDDLLRHAADLLRGTFRESDILARIGGDEFAILLPATNETMAEQMLLRVKARLKEQNKAARGLPVELSLGMATTDNGNLTDVFSLADRRMYADKAVHKSKEINTSAS